MEKNKPEEQITATEKEPTPEKKLIDQLLDLKTLTVTQKILILVSMKN